LNQEFWLESSLDESSTWLKLKYSTWCNQSMWTTVFMSMMSLRKISRKCFWNMLIYMYLQKSTRLNIWKSSFCTKFTKHLFHSHYMRCKLTTWLNWLSIFTWWRTFQIKISKSMNSEYLLSSIWYARWTFFQNQRNFLSFLKCDDLFIHDFWMKTKLHYLWEHRLNLKLLL